MNYVAVTVLLIAEVTLTAAGSARTWAQGVVGDPDLLYAERARLESRN
jgi:hypothetical protein